MESTLDWRRRSGLDGSTGTGRREACNTIDRLPLQRSRWLQFSIRAWTRPPASSTRFPPTARRSPTTVAERPDGRPRPAGLAGPHPTEDPPGRPSSPSRRSGPRQPCSAAWWSARRCCRSARRSRAIRWAGHEPGSSRSRSSPSARSSCVAPTTTSRRCPRNGAPPESWPTRAATTPRAWPAPPASWACEPSS